MKKEKDIYSFLKCRAYTNIFKDFFPFDFNYSVFDKSLDHIFAYHLKNQSTSQIDSYAYRTVLKAFNSLKDSSKLPQQLSKDLNDLTLALNQLLNIMVLEEKVPVFGPLYHNVSHHGVNLKIKSRSIYRDFEDGYISFYLSPYTSSFEAKNDPIPYVLYSELKKIISSVFPKDKTLTIKVIYFNKNEYNAFNITYKNAKAFNRLSNILHSIDIDETPIYKCTYKCKYKKECKL